jgi:hypothetical protein
MGIVAIESARRGRVPPRSPYLTDAVWLITLFESDEALVPLVRHLHRVHGVVTVGDLDTAGWSVVNTYADRIDPGRMASFFGAIGRKTPRPGRSATAAEVRVVPFKSARPSGRCGRGRPAIPRADRHRG